MAENPLLPHRRLIELYELMKSVHSLNGRRPETAGYEAVRAATLIQMEAGDVLCPRNENKSTAVLSKQNKRGRKAESSPFGSSEQHALRDPTLPDLAALIALGMKTAGRKNVAISITNPDIAANWTAVLTMAQAERLPLIVIIADRTSPDKKLATDLTWDSMSRLARKLKLPTVAVDGEDAVALYRVVQECMHRAKHGDGPALVWCSYLAETSQHKASRSIAGMERYLAVRGLGPRAGKSS